MILTRAFKYGIGGLLAIGLGALSLGAAATIVYTTWQSAATGQQGTTGAVTALSFNQYNAAAFGGSALLSVQIQLDGVGYGVYRFTNATSATNTFTFITDVAVKVANLSGGNLIVAIPTVQDIQRVLTPSGVYTSAGYGPPQNFNVGLTGMKNTSQTYVGATLTPALLALFSGTGTVALPTSATIANLTQSSGDNDTSIRSRYNGTLRVRYGYDLPADAPEPATLLLLGVGATGLGLRRRLRAAP